MKFNFEDPSQLAISDQAKFRIRIKDPAMLKTLLTMSSLTREMVFSGQSYFERSIPAQITNAA